MCGRFTLRNLDDLKARYGETDFSPSYNVAPGQQILTITDKFQTMEWGFTPYWAEKPFNLINARIETLFEKPSFTNSNRCLIPADGWYEWKQKDEVFLLPQTRGLPPTKFQVNHLPAKFFLPLKLYPRQFAAPLGMGCHRQKKHFLVFDLLYFLQGFSSQSISLPAKQIDRYH